MRDSGSVDESCGRQRERRPHTTSTSASDMSAGCRGSDRTSSRRVRRPAAAQDARCAERALTRNREGIVHERADASGRQVRLAADRGRRSESGRDDRRGQDRTPAARRPVRAGEAAADSGPPASRRRAVHSGSQRQTRAQNRGLHFVEPAVDAKLVVTVLIRLAAVPQALQFLGDRRVVGHHRAAIAERAEILRRIEAERAGDADRADWRVHRTVARCAWHASSTTARAWRCAMAPMAAYPRADRRDAPA